MQYVVKSGAMPSALTPAIRRPITVAWVAPSRKSKRAPISSGASPDCQLLPLLGRTSRPRPSFVSWDGPRLPVPVACSIPVGRGQYGQGYLVLHGVRYLLVSPPGGAHRHDCGDGLENQLQLGKVDRLRHVVDDLAGAWRACDRVPRGPGRERAWCSPAG